jgi:hypothetical protein
MLPLTSLRSPPCVYWRRRCTDTYRPVERIPVPSHMCSTCAMKGSVRVAIVLALGAGCSGGGGPEKEDPVDKCHAWLAQICTRFVECAPDEFTYDECVRSLFANVFSCDSHAVGVGDTYDTCMGQLASTSCEILVPIDPESGARLELPAGCLDAIILD